MSVFGANGNNRVVISGVSINLGVSGHNKIMAVVDEIIRLSKRFLTCDKVKRRGGEMVCGTFVVLSCGRSDAGECFVPKTHFLENIDLFGQICKENNMFEMLEHANRQATVKP